MVTVSNATDITNTALIIIAGKNAASMSCAQLCPPRIMAIAKRRRQSALYAAPIIKADENTCARTPLKRVRPLAEEIRYPSS
jgi:hypothetical protein